MTVKSAVTGKGIRISPSAAKTFWRCKRKWWYQKVFGLPTPTSKAMELGTAVHAELEAYLAHGTEPSRARAGRIASRGIDLLPDPKEVEERGGTVELRVSGKCGPLPYLGFVDYLEWPEGEHPHVWDHKTTSDYKWSKTAEELGKDPQMLFYAYAVFHGLPHQPSHVKMTHVYYLTKGQGSRRVDAIYDGATDIPWGVAQKTWDRYVQTAETMADLASVEDQNKVPFNILACGDFGGCPFSERCTKARRGPRKKITRAKGATTRGKAPKPESAPMGKLSDKIKAKEEKKRRKAAKKAAKRAAEAAAESDAPSILPPDAAPQSKITEPLFAEAVAVYKGLVLAMPDGVSDKQFKATLVRMGVPTEMLDDIKAAAAGDEEPASALARHHARNKAIEAVASEPTTPAVDPNADEPDPVALSRAMANRFEHGPPVKERLTDVDPGGVDLGGQGVKRLIKECMADLYGDKHGFRLTKNRVAAILQAGNDAALWDANVEAQAIRLTTAKPAEAIEIDTSEYTEPVVRKGPGKMLDETYSKMLAETCTIYVDCFPELPIAVPLLAGPGAFFSDIVAEVEREANVSYYGLMDFDHGPKAVAARVTLEIEREGLPPGHFFLSGAEPACGKVLEVFRRAGASVVRGAR